MGCADAYGEASTNARRALTGDHDASAASTDRPGQRRRGTLVTAYEELKTTGDVGDQTLATLRRLARQYTRTHSFRPPEGYARWDDHAVDDLLGSLFASKGSGFVLACLAHASDDASLERLLLTTIGNHLKDQAKGTERGKLRRRLEHLMNHDQRFVRVGAADAGVAGWALADGPATLTMCSSTDFLKAAFAVRGVSITKWNAAGPTPAETRRALLIVVEAILAAAVGAVRDEDLARAIEARFALLHPLQFTELRPDEPGQDPADPDPEPAAVIAVEIVAEDLWRGMDQIERSLLLHLIEPHTVPATIAGTGPRQARAIADALAEKLRLATVDDPQREDVVRALLHKCEMRP